MVTPIIEMKKPTVTEMKSLPQSDHNETCHCALLTGWLLTAPVMAKTSA
jgi:hypothetical protein